jgi:glycosyltransferase involved in cell wall biosynthesis
MIPAKVSAVIITLNEADNIGRTVDKLGWCDEVIIVDSYSSDDTVAICVNKGCQVFQRQFDGYGTQKQYAVSLAKNNWVLCIDADEVLTDELVQEIQEEMKNPAADAYLMQMEFVFINRVFKYGKESSKSYIRLFNKSKGTYNSDKVHESLELQGTVKKMKGKILHYSYKSIAHYFEKFNRYSSLGAQLAVEKNKQKPLIVEVIAVPYYFFRYYFFELNFLNGIQGFYWSAFQSFYHFVKYTKTREAWRIKKEQQQ